MTRASITSLALPARMASSPRTFLFLMMTLRSGTLFSLPRTFFPPLHHSHLCQRPRLPSPASMEYATAAASARHVHWSCAGMARPPSATVPAAIAHAPVLPLTSARRSAIAVSTSQRPSRICLFFMAGPDQPPPFQQLRPPPAPFLTIKAAGVMCVRSSVGKTNGATLSPCRAS